MPPAAERHQADEDPHRQAGEDPPVATRSRRGRGRSTSRCAAGRWPAGPGVGLVDDSKGTGGHHQHQDRGHQDGEGGGPELAGPPQAAGQGRGRPRGGAGAPAPRLRLRARLRRRRPDRRPAGSWRLRISRGPSRQPLDLQPAGRHPGLRPAARTAAFRASRASVVSRADTASAAATSSSPPRATTSARTSGVTFSAGCRLRSSASTTGRPRRQQRVGR